jgi:hypothetical protein
MRSGTGNAATDFLSVVPERDRFQADGRGAHEGGEGREGAEAEWFSFAYFARFARESSEWYVGALAAEAFSAPRHRVSEGYQYEVGRDFQARRRRARGGSGPLTSSLVGASGAGRGGVGSSRADAASVRTPVEEAGIHWQRNVLTACVRGAPAPPRVSPRKGCCLCGPRLGNIFLAPL